MNKSQQPHFAGMAQIETGRPHNSPVRILAGAAPEPIIRPWAGTEGNNGLILDPDRYDLLTPEEVLLGKEAMEEEEPNPFKTIRDALEFWKIEYDDCPGMATLLDAIDRAGIGRSFDLKFWLQAWRRA